MSHADSSIRTMVTFQSTTFNTTEPKGYFINACCYGDDVAKWLIHELRTHGMQTDETPGQEDFGWYLNFAVDRGLGHTLVLSYRPAAENDVGSWIGWLERRRGFIGYLIGVRKRGIEMGAVQAIHRTLSGSQFVFNVRWHFRGDFEAGREELGSSSP